MKLKTQLNAIGSRIATGAALTVAGIGSALAQATDPTAEIVSTVQAGGANGVKVAVAIVIAGFSIYAIYMMRRKG